jgi:8-oxo-dGTP pyrophosphatase MutT (NUDIX family)
MNKRIYFQNRYLQFSDPELQPQQNQIFNWEQGLKTQTDSLKLLNAFMAEENVKSFILPANTFDLFMTVAKKELHYIEAAGGFIEKDAQYLCIHRLGRWDLPKGKLEKNETIEAAAVRECEEECGIGELRIQYPLHSTFHLYPYKKGIAIKQSFWFYMHSSWQKPLVAQTEESIDEVRWFSKEEIIRQVLPDTYFTIHDVIREALKLG